MANIDVLIVGGGVIGLSLARELHRLGQKRIAIVDRGQIGREASFAAAGMLAPNSENEVIDDLYHLCDASRRMFPDLATELLAETGVNIELDRTGTLFAAFTEKDEAGLNVRFSRQTEAGIVVEKLSGSDTQKAEPAISPRVRSSLFFPNDWQVENRKLVAALAEYAAKCGITIIEDADVLSILVSGKAAGGVRTRNGEIHADVTVLATGAWTSLINVGGEPLPVQVKPVRGHIICYRPPTRTFTYVIHSPRGYLVPRRDGRVLVGGTSDQVGFDSGRSPEAEAALKARACEFAPNLANMPISESWAGLRPFRDGGLPIIGEVDGYQQLFVGTGHYRNGILLAPVTARILAHRIAFGQDEPNFGALAAAMSRPVESNAFG